MELIGRRWAGAILYALTNGPLHFAELKKRPRAEVLSVVNIFRIPELVKVASRYVETDLSPNDLLTLAFFGKDVQMNAVRTATLPGHPAGVRVNYWVVDAEPAQLLLDRLVLDNPRLPQGSDASKPLKVGLYYDPALAARRMARPVN